MGFRLIWVIMSLSIISVGAIAANEKVKYETIKGERVQVEGTEKVKAAPLSEPESSRLRQKRQQMEMETEEKIIQQLEEARMEDEKNRRQQLFEKELRTRESELEDPYMDPEPVVEVQREPVTEESDTLEWEPVSQGNDITTTVIVDDVDEPKPARFYFGLGAGGVNHQAQNTPDMNGTGGITFGSYLSRYFILEGAFMYSFLETNRSILPDEDVDMFHFAAVPKFTFGMNDQVVTPVVGPVLAFTRRQYNGGDNASNALDAGISAGIDIALNQQVKIGIEGRYMTNLDYEKDEPLDATEKALEEFATGNDIRPLEDFDYTIFMANVKMVF